MKKCLQGILPGTSKSGKMSRKMPPTPLLYLDCILESMLEWAKQGPCGSNAINSISNSLLALQPKVRFALHSGLLLAPFSAHFWRFSHCRWALEKPSEKSHQKSQKHVSKRVRKPSKKVLKTKPRGPQKRLGTIRAALRSSYASQGLFLTHL